MMGSYSYKDVMYRDDFQAAIKPAMESCGCGESEYIGDANYDGDGWVVAAFLLDQKDAALTAERERADRAEKALLVPGEMRCAKCKFTLIRTNLYVNNGTTGPGGNETEPCPNGCGPLWPETWERSARDAWARLETAHDELIAERERADRAERCWLPGEPPKPYRDEWFIAETIHGDRVVLKALPDEYTYDYKTADETYFAARNIKRWMQFPDSEYVAAAEAERDALRERNARLVGENDEITDLNQTQFLELEHLRRISDAAHRLYDESEEYEFVDGLGRGAPQELWDALSTAIDTMSDAQRTALGDK